jgi:hypothetical protein
MTSYSTVASPMTTTTNGRVGRSPYTTSSFLIFRRLLSRSLKKQRLGLQVHNQSGLFLHILWSARNKNKGAWMQFLERRYLFSSEMEDVWKDMANRPIGEVCSCMWDDLPWEPILDHREPQCASTPHLETGLMDGYSASWAEVCV